MQDRPVPWQQLAAKLLPCWRLLAPCPCWLLPPRQNLAQYITTLLRERWRLDCHRARAGRVCYRVLRWQPCSHSTAVHQGPVRPPSAATLVELVLHSNKSQQAQPGAPLSRLGWYCKSSSHPLAQLHALFSESRIPSILWGHCHMLQGGGQGGSTAHTRAAEQWQLAMQRGQQGKA